MTVEEALMKIQQLIERTRVVTQELTAIADEQTELTEALIRVSQAAATEAEVEAPEPLPDLSAPVGYEEYIERYGEARPNLARLREIVMSLVSRGLGVQQQAEFLEKFAPAPAVVGRSTLFAIANDQYPYQERESRHYPPVSEERARLISSTLGALLALPEKQSSEVAEQLG